MSVVRRKGPTYHDVGHRGLACDDVGHRGPTYRGVGHPYGSVGMEAQLTTLSGTEAQPTRLEDR